MGREGALLCRGTSGAWAAGWAAGFLAKQGKGGTENCWPHAKGMIHSFLKEAGVGLVWRVH